MIPQLVPQGQHLVLQVLPVQQAALVAQLVLVLAQGLVPLDQQDSVLGFVGPYISFFIFMNTASKISLCS